MLRVIAGTAKGRRLKSVPGAGTRPALAQVRAAVFNIAQSYVPGSRFLDLFAGTGAYAIEALSRGAATATLVELNPEAIAVIRHNLRICGFEEHSTVIHADVLRAVERLSRQGDRFDIIMVAPPYFHGLGPRTVEKLAALGLLEPGGLCFMQHSAKEQVRAESGDLAVVRSYSYGSNMLSLYRHKA
ncbi:MAG: 16S rRNA (guanine(966)-N(2))-methyltransferase RsmD [Ignavibacteriales bacterium]